MGAHWRHPPSLIPTQAQEPALLSAKSTRQAKRRSDPTPKLASHSVAASALKAHQGERQLTLSLR